MRHIQEHSRVFRVLTLAVALAIASTTAQAGVDSMLASGSYQLGAGALVNLTSQYPLSNPVDVLTFPASGINNAGLHSYGSTGGNFGSRSSGNGVYDVAGAFTIIETITNNSAVAQAATFNFFITPGMLANYINSTLTAGEFLVSGVNFDIRRNGSSVWSSAATLSSNDAGTTFNATGDTGLYSGANSFYTINGVSRSIALGIINANESINLSYTLNTFASGNSAGGPGQFVPETTYQVPDQWISDCKRVGKGNVAALAFGNPCVPGPAVFVPGHSVTVPAHTIPAGQVGGSHGSSGDPFTIDFSNGNPIFTTNGADPKGSNVVLSDVPEPATSALLLAGLGLLGFMSRRKRTPRALK